ncbi:uncharacterized protein N7518_003812 [Penicillium psychrosexuale]|uniref:uncharacterized protein n=1 Tax=Penicillium psychrosexuale TaxID=1002107 RepID=UPI00254537CB|nr:uncharacterized protein N7518_003812 [Penicillium psychrosexuale]KAJ5801744.1 hypothetical protein N7518_003812 [Penicillium psychrosexuale]
MSSKPRTGCPPKVNDQTTSYIARLMKKDDRPSWAAIAAGVDRGLSKSTVGRVTCSQNAYKLSQEKASTPLTVKKARKKAVAVYAKSETAE